ncbi:arginine deiminase-related protein [Galbibacter sp. EGI 63066]|uniref:citrulline utilization hydrolase CtlX n=1 Tax=Galbibacter sp. EGI 63066 TaxID=2993559 RepID=UPI0022490136|nr:arginine deiminase-related protein [Galbibacter sp. EGI 63066]MCX2679535.1 arginine deiminase-related protein [Galbibacter sp. EGI 63066]
MSQITDTILMIRPVNFRMNEQTAVNNYFQENTNVLNETINAKAQREFDAFVEKLRAVGVHVIVVEDSLESDTPDAIFPNNWMSTHEDGTLVLYPMFAENRRNERREEVLKTIEKEGFLIENVMDYTSAEEEEVFLEGTGSIVLDRVNRKAYCALSPRADEELFIEFCEDFEYLPVIFTAYQSVDNERKPIYHTNVMMCVGDDFTVVCLDSIDDKKERKNLVNHLKKDGKEVVAISEEQIHHFAGNMLQVKSQEDKKYLVMSDAAEKSLTEKQRTTLEKYSTILSGTLETIEICGGGSARCMMAEIFLPKK